MKFLAPTGGNRDAPHPTSLPRGFSQGSWEGQQEAIAASGPEQAMQWYVLPHFSAWPFPLSTD